MSEYEYTILKPPPRRHRLAWITLGVTLAVVAVGVGAFLVGRHTTSAPPSTASAPPKLPRNHRLKSARSRSIPSAAASPAPARQST